MSLASSSRCVADVASVIPAPTDVAVDTLGRYVAVAGENGKVAVSDMGANAAIVATFDGHDSCIDRIGWAHHRLGLLLLTSDEGTTKVWAGPQEAPAPGQPVEFRQVHAHSLPGGCNGAAWAPFEYGIMYAAAGIDGQVTILCARGPQMDQWEQQHFTAHPGGCHALSWSPCAAPGTLLQMPLGVPQGNQQQQQQQGINLPSPRIVTCGPERSVRVWRYLAQDRHWLQEQELAELPQDVALVRDVSWASNPGLPFGYIAAGSEQGAVGVWLQDGTDGKWKFVNLPRFNSPVCRVGWSSAGTLLNVSCADGASSTWTEQPSGEWAQVFVTQRE